MCDSNYYYYSLIIIIIILKGNAGIYYSLVIILMTEVVALISILSSIGICERCHLDSGGIYCLLSRVLGNRIGATIGIIYCFGQVR